MEERTDTDAIVYTDEASVYAGLLRAREAVKHSVGEYVRRQARTNGLASFWANMKRGYQDGYHWMSSKRLHRYVSEFEHCHNGQAVDTLTQMTCMVREGAGKRLRYIDLIGPMETRLNTQTAMV